MSKSVGLYDSPNPYNEIDIEIVTKRIEEKNITCEFCDCPAVFREYIENASYEVCEDHHENIFNKHIESEESLRGDL